MIFLLTKYGSFEGYQISLDKLGRSVERDLMLNVGEHTMALYETPVPNITHIPLEPHLDKKSWQRYNEKATLKILVFDTPKGPDSVNSSFFEEEIPASLPAVCIYYGFSVYNFSNKLPTHLTSYMMVIIVHISNIIHHCSYFKHHCSYFKHHTSLFILQTSYMMVIIVHISNIIHHCSYFKHHTSLFILQTSYIIVHTSNIIHHCSYFKHHT